MIINLYVYIMGLVNYLLTCLLNYIYIYAAYGYVHICIYIAIGEIMISTNKSNISEYHFDIVWFDSSYFNLSLHFCAVQDAPFWHAEGSEVRSHQSYR